MVKDRTGLEPRGIPKLCSYPLGEGAWYRFKMGTPAEELEAILSVKSDFFHLGDLGRPEVDTESQTRIRSHH